MTAISKKSLTHALQRLSHFASPIENIDCNGRAFDPLGPALDIFRDEIGKKLPHHRFIGELAARTHALELF